MTNVLNIRALPNHNELAVPLSHVSPAFSLLHLSILHYCTFIELHWSRFFVSVAHKISPLNIWQWENSRAITFDAWKGSKRTKLSVLNVLNFEGQLIWVLDSSNSRFKLLESIPTNCYIILIGKRSKSNLFMTFRRESIFLITISLQQHIKFEAGSWKIVECVIFMNFLAVLITKFGVFFFKNFNYLFQCWYDSRDVREKREKKSAPSCYPER